MGKALCALAVTSIGIVATIESDFWPIDKVRGAEVIRGMIDGVILGLIMLSSSADLNSVLGRGRQED
jgi:hypothetical protein